MLHRLRSFERVEEFKNVRKPKRPARTIPPKVGCADIFSGKGGNGGCFGSYQRMKHTHTF